KLHATERMRQSVNAAMDIHAGKAVIDGPSNYLGNLYRALPVAITVEGANILTRSLIVFGQGAIRAHPYLMEEITAVGNSDQAAGEDAFDAVIWKHLAHSGKNALRAIGTAWTSGVFTRAPRQAGPTAAYYRGLNRYAAAFALMAEVTLLTLGGSLKRKEMLSARLGDILAELFLVSAVLKRWHDEGKHEPDLPLVRLCVQQSFAAIEKRMDEILLNFPSRGVSWVMRALLLPPRMRAAAPTAKVVAACANILLEPSASRSRLVGQVREGHDSPSVEQLERAFECVIETQP